MSNTDRIVYVDMDGVLVDFDGGFHAIFGMGPKEYATQHGKRADFTAVYERGEQFWEIPPQAKGMSALWHFLEENFLNIKILTSAGVRDDPNVFNMVREGKLGWLKKNIPSMAPDDVIVVPIKRLKVSLAKPGDILIDDDEKNIDQWNGAGGVGILHNQDHFIETINILNDYA